MSIALEEQLYEIEDLDSGQEKIKLIERIVKEAQKINNLDIEYNAKIQLLRTASDIGQPEKLITCFTWLLATNDQHPDRFPLWELLWYYKWAVNQVAKFPTISRKRILDIMDDMERRYVGGGFSKKPILYFKRNVYSDFGEPEMAEQLHQEWSASEEYSLLSDCGACILNSIFKYEVRKGNYEKALEIVEPIIRKEQTCGNVPKHTYSTVVKAYYKLNQFEKAIPFYHSIVKELEMELPQLSDYGDALIFLGLTENYIIGKEIITKQLQHALDYKCEYYPMQFYISVLFFLKALKMDKHTEMTLPVQIKLPVKNENGNYQVEDLIQFFDGEIDRIAALFDKRNGNKAYSKMKEADWYLLEWKRKVML